MARIGFSQRKTVAYLYAWTLMLAGVALALAVRPVLTTTIGHYRLGWSIVMGAILLLAAAASVYLVYVLEIFKFKSLRTIQLRRLDPETTRARDRRDRRARHRDRRVRGRGEVVACGSHASPS